MRTVLSFVLETHAAAPWRRLSHDPSFRWSRRGARSEVLVRPPESRRVKAATE